LLAAQDRAALAVTDRSHVVEGPTQGSGPRVRRSRPLTTPRRVHRQLARIVLLLFTSSAPPTAVRPRPARTRDTDSSSMGFVLLCECGLRHARTRAFTRARLRHTSPGARPTAARPSAPLPVLHPCDQSPRRKPLNADGSLAVTPVSAAHSVGACHSFARLQPPRNAPRVSVSHACDGRELVSNRRESGGAAGRPDDPMRKRAEVEMKGGESADPGRSAPTATKGKERPPKVRGARATPPPAPGR